jgi:uncharacterized protein
MSRAVLWASTYLLVVLAAAVVLKVLVSSLESRLVFFPFKGEDANPAALGIPYQQVALTTSDGERLTAWQLEPAHPLADIVYFHGNGGNLSVWLPVLANLHRRNLRVFAVDYRGYGLSTGSPTEEGVYRDAEAVALHVQRTRARTTTRPLVYWGRSLGGAIAAGAARVVSPDGLILESTFPDKAAVVRTQPILRMLNVFAAYRFSTIDALRGFSKPVLVMHGDQDSIIPFTLGQELFERLEGAKRFVAIRGGDHNDAFDSSNEAYWKPVVDFIGGAG